MGKKTKTPITSDPVSPDKLKDKLTNVKLDHKKKIEKPPHLEFGGPVGTFFTIVGLPIVIWGLFFICNKETCLQNPSTFDWQKLLTVIPPFHEWFSLEASLVYLGWMLFNVFLERVLPGEAAYGSVLPDGTKLKYVLSGHLQFWLCLLAMVHVVPRISLSSSSGSESPSVWEWFSAIPRIHGFMPLALDRIYDMYLPLISISVLSTFLFSLYLYISSFSNDENGKPRILAKGGNTGFAIYDFFIGRELNPRWWGGTFDLKEFCELRPGLIGWLVINLGMAVKQYRNRMISDGVGSISASMFFVTLLQGIYVWDALHMERAILTTMDITTDGFGFMLCFGDLSWVPFIYSLQARYLVDYDPNLSIWQVGVILFIQFLGYYIFRSANSEKDAFRRNPNAPEVKHLKFMETKRGTKLLTSGWWGSARKINYTGDWLITLSWCLLCGFSSPVPYFQAIYFLVLLIHRAIRDDQFCAEKYGEDWLEYKRRVPYMFVPGVV